MTDENIEGIKGSVIIPRPHNWEVAEAVHSALPTTLRGIITTA